MESQISEKKKSIATWKMVILAVIGFALLFFISKLIPTSKPKIVEKPTNEIINYELTGPQNLLNDYSGNEVSADNKYKDRWLKIVGHVDKVDKDFLGNVIVSMKTSNRFMPVRCYLKNNDDIKVANLKENDNITIYGKGSGSTLGSPVVKECTIE